jgi:histone H3/H4
MTQHRNLVSPSNIKQYASTITTVDELKLGARYQHTLHAYLEKFIREFSQDINKLPKNHNITIDDLKKIEKCQRHIDNTELEICDVMRLVRKNCDENTKFCNNTDMILRKWVVSKAKRYIKKSVKLMEFKGRKTLQLQDLEFVYEQDQI